MTYPETVALSKLAEAAGYQAEIRRLIGNYGWRVYLIDGNRWTWIEGEDDLEDVRTDPDLWVRGSL